MKIWRIQFCQRSSKGHATLERLSRHKIERTLVLRTVLKLSDIAILFKTHYCIFPPIIFVLSMLGDDLFQVLLWDSSRPRAWNKTEKLASN